MIGAILVLIGLVLAIVDCFAPRRLLLHAAVILIALGVLIGAEPLISVKAD